MSEKVVRYRVVDSAYDDPDFPCRHIEHDEGDWVYYSDYEALQANTEKLEKELSSICDTETADEYEDRIDILVRIANERAQEIKRLRDALRNVKHAAGEHSKAWVIADLAIIKSRTALKETER